MATTRKPSKGSTSRTSRTTRTSSPTQDESREKRTVKDIVIERLIKRIEEENILPWQKPFQTACMNWYSNREYIGINKLLLDGGEYITFKQLMAYNAKHKTDHRIEKGTPYEIVVFYSPKLKRISGEEAQKLIKSGFHRLVRPTEDGTGWVKIRFILRYFRVYNITNVQPNSQGEKLESKIGKTIFEVHTPAEQIIETYCNATGVQLRTDHNGAFYRESTDSVYSPPPTYYKSQEAYYRVLFHELIHSTGIKTRLNRESLKHYSEGSRDRSREELIAEIGGLLLASEAGFREDTEWADNSIEYVAGWCQWMKENPTEVLNGMLAAEKAKNYILSGGQVASGGADAKISGLRSNDDVDSTDSQVEPDEIEDDDGE